MNEDILILDGDVEGRHASDSAIPNVAPPAGNNPPETEERGGHSASGDHSPIATPQLIPARKHGGRQAIELPTTTGAAPAGEDLRFGGAGEAVHCSGDTQRSIDRFADPLVAEIVETWRARQDMVRAQQKLTLQAKAICRRFTAGDKTEAEKLYGAIAGKGSHPFADAAGMAISGLLAAQVPLITQRDAYEKHLGKLGKRLPIAHVADEIKGVNHKTLATIVGELGDLSAYEKGVAGIWKRAGLAVINGERQRKKSDKDEAILHGYAPARRSTFWNIGAALLKAQGTGENALEYRQVYDERKEYELANGLPKAHAHNRAMRFMTKRLLRELWRSWRDASGGHHNRDIQHRPAAGGTNSNPVRPDGACRPEDARHPFAPRLQAQTSVDGDG